MSEKSGFILKVEGGGKAISYHAEQRQEFIDMNKMFVHYLNDDFGHYISNGTRKKLIFGRSFFASF